MRVIYAGHVMSSYYRAFRSVLFIAKGENDDDIGNIRDASPIRLNGHNAESDDSDNLRDLSPFHADAENGADNCVTDRLRGLPPFDLDEPRDDSDFDKRCDFPSSRRDKQRSAMETNAREAMVSVVTDEMEYVPEQYSSDTNPRISRSTVDTLNAAAMEPPMVDERAREVYRVDMVEPDAVVTVAVDVVTERKLAAVTARGELTGGMGEEDVVVTPTDGLTEPATHLGNIEREHDGQSDDGRSTNGPPTMVYEDAPGVALVPELENGDAKFDAVSLPTSVSEIPRPMNLAVGDSKQQLVHDLTGQRTQQWDVSNEVTFNNTTTTGVGVDGTTPEEIDGKSKESIAQTSRDIENAAFMTSYTGERTAYTGVLDEDSSQNGVLSDNDQELWDSLQIKLTSRISTAAEDSTIGCNVSNASVAIASQIDRSSDDDVIGASLKAVSEQVTEDSCPANVNNGGDRAAPKCNLKNCVNRGTNIMVSRLPIATSGDAGDVTVSYAGEQPSYRTQTAIVADDTQNNPVSGAETTKERPPPPVDTADVSSNVVSSDVMSSDVISSDVMSSDVSSNGVMSSDVISSDVPSNGVLSNAVMSSDVISSDGISNDVMSSDFVSSDVVSSDVISSDVISSDVISSDVKPCQEQVPVCDESDQCDSCNQGVQSSPPAVIEAADDIGRICTSCEHKSPVDARRTQHVHWSDEHTGEADNAEDLSRLTRDEGISLNTLDAENGGREPSSGDVRGRVREGHRATRVGSDRETTSRGIDLILNDDREELGADGGLLDTGTDETDAGVEGSGDGLVATPDTDSGHSSPCGGRLCEETGGEANDNERPPLNGDTARVGSADESASWSDSEKRSDSLAAGEDCDGDRVVEQRTGVVDDSVGATSGYESEDATTTHDREDVASTSSSAVGLDTSPPSPVRKRAHGEVRESSARTPSRDDGGAVVREKYGVSEGERRWPVVDMVVVFVVLMDLLYWLAQFLLPSVQT